jgi:hypothetical protein
MNICHVYVCICLGEACIRGVCMYVCIYVCVYVDKVPGQHCCVTLTESQGRAALRRHTHWVTAPWRTDSHHSCHSEWVTECLPTVRWLPLQTYAGSCKFVSFVCVLCFRVCVLSCCFFSFSLFFVDSFPLFILVGFHVFSSLISRFLFSHHYLGNAFFTFLVNVLFCNGFLWLVTGASMCVCVCRRHVHAQKENTRTGWGGAQLRVSLFWVFK